MFAEIHDYFEKVKAEVEALGKADLAALAADVRTAYATEKDAILQQVANSAPEIQAAVKQTLAMLEQALLAVLAAKGL